MMIAQFPLKMIPKDRCVKKCESALAWITCLISSHLKRHDEHTISSPQA